MTAALFVALISTAIWLYLLFARGRFWRAKNSDEVTLPSLNAYPNICVIIPARNEADMLGQTIPTLLANDYPVPLRVVLVDDRSEDNTAHTAMQVADALHASDRLTLISGDAAPGWKGKVRAMQCGLERLSSLTPAPRYVLFTDADIAYDKGVLTKLVARAESGGLVLTSLMARLRCESAAEHWLIPAFVYFFQLLYPFDWVNDRKRKIAAAAGGCMLVRYDALLKAGGLTPIRDALIDDCALGRLMKPHGPIWLGLTQNVHSLRPYPHLNDIRSMITRSAFDQLGYSPLNLIGMLLGLFFIYIAPVDLALFARGTAQFLGVACWLWMGVSLLPMSSFYKRSPFMGLALPAIALCYMTFTVQSAVQYWRGKGGVWKGRVQATHTKNI